MGELDLVLEYKRRELFKLLASGASLLVPVEIQGAETNIRVRRAADGSIEAFTGKIDMGQGLATLLSQAVAEELGVAVNSVKLTMGDTDLTPDDGGTWASLTTPETVPAMRQAAAELRGGELSKPAGWKTLGQSVKNINGPAIVTGAFVYNSDVKVEGMVHGIVIRPPYYRARLEQAEGEGVVREGDFAGVWAPTLDEARAKAAGVKVKWSHQSLPAHDAMLASFKEQSTAPVENNQTRYPPLIRTGDAASALSKAGSRWSGTYSLAPITHASLEPRSAIAWFTPGGRLNIRCGKQAPFVVRAEVAKAMGMKEADVHIIVDLPGGGFGGKQRSDVEVEAARLARAAQKPVRVEWTREEEFIYSLARPAALIEIETALDEQGRITAWRHRNYNAGAPGLKPPYDFKDQSSEFWRTPAPLRQGSYRSLAAAGNNFAREMAMEECAARAKQDPLAYRLSHIADARLREVLERAAERFGYKGAKAGTGLSANIEKEGRLALFTECAVEPFRILRIVCVADFGAALNPGNLENQVTGGIIMGLGGALWERLEFNSEAQLTKRLGAYRVPRFRDIPKIDVQIVDRRDHPSAGAGEAPITMPAPAIAAALHSLTGQWRRSLPLLASAPALK